MIKQGPIDDRTWPSHIECHAIEPGFPPRIHGYDVQRDLARHYDFAETVLIYLTGEPPTDEIGQAFNVALTFLSPVTVTQSPSHMAALARVLDTPDPNIIVLGALGVAHQGHDLFTRFTAWLTWLDAPTQAPPEAFIASNSDETQTLATLRQSLGKAIAVCPVVARHNLLPDAALIAVLHGCGIRSQLQISAVLTVARIPAIAAEAQTRDRGDLRRYPLRLPDFASPEPHRG